MKLDQHALQVPAAEDQQVIKALAPGSPHPALANEFARGDR